MTTLTEGQAAGEFIVSESGTSREAVTVLSGENLDAGEVIGKVTRAVGGAVAVLTGTGNGTMTNIKPGKLAKPGAYTVTCTTAVTNGGVFSVTDPDGNALPVLTLTVGAGAATTYTSDDIVFTVTDGSTDFVATDEFVITLSTTVPVVTGTGDGVITLLTMGKETKRGTYIATCTAAATNGGTFVVIDPDGNLVGEDFVLSAGAGNTTAFSSNQINFSITDGSTDFAADDYFNIAVYGGTDKVVEWDPTAVDGREDPAGVLFDAVDASAADTAGVIIARNAEVSASDLQYAAAITAAQKEVAKTRLSAELSIVAR